MNCCSASVGNRRPQEAGVKLRLARLRSGFKRLGRMGSLSHDQRNIVRQCFVSLRDVEVKDSGSRIQDLQDLLVQRFKKHLLRCSANRSCEWWIYVSLYRRAIRHELLRHSYYWKRRKLRDLQRPVGWKGDAPESLKKFMEDLAK